MYVAAVIFQHAVAELFSHTLCCQNRAFAQMMRAEASRVVGYVFAHLAGLLLYVLLALMVLMVECIIPASRRMF